MKIYFTIFLIILSIGILVISNTLHELTHYYDMKDEVNVNEICALRIPLSLSDLKGQNGFAYAYMEYLPGKQVNSSEVLPSIISLASAWLMIFVCWKCIFKKEEKEVKKWNVNITEKKEKDTITN